MRGSVQKGLNQRILTLELPSFVRGIGSGYFVLKIPRQGHPEKKFDLITCTHVRLSPVHPSLMGAKTSPSLFTFSSIYLGHTTNLPSVCITQVSVNGCEFGWWVLLEISHSLILFSQACSGLWAVSIFLGTSFVSTETPLLGRLKLLRMS